MQGRLSGKDRERGGVLEDRGCAAVKLAAPELAELAGILLTLQLIPQRWAQT